MGKLDRRLSRPDGVDVPNAGASWDDVYARLDPEVEAGDRIGLWAAENEDGSFRVGDSVRRDPELFLRWLERHEPEHIVSEFEATRNAQHRASKRLQGRYRVRHPHRPGRPTPAALLTFLDDERSRR